MDVYAGWEEALLRENREAARATNTQIGMQAAWRRWAAYAAPRGIPMLPASPPEVERFLVVYMAHERRLALATIKHTAWAIDAVHREQGLPPPGHSADVRTALQGLRRRLRHPPKQARALTIADIAKMRFGSAEIDRRDKALLLLGWAACLRRSELVALDVGDIAPHPKGLLVTVRHSKTDQDGAGAAVFVARAERYPACCPVKAMSSWLRSLPSTPGPLFRSLSRRGEGPRLSGTDVDRVIKKWVTRAGLGEGYSGHSLRAGGATWLAEHGLHATLIARHGRWASLDQVLTYARGDVAAHLVGTY